LGRFDPMKWGDTRNHFRSDAMCPDPKTDRPTDSSPEEAATALVQGSVKLVSLPHVCIRVNLMVDDPTYTSADIGAVIQQDASLTARLLRIANSAMFGFRSRIDTVSRAVTVIGQRDLRDLVFAVAAVRTFNNIPVDLANMASFWRHSLFTGIVAKLLAKRCSVLHSERLFVAGLLHDLGQLLIYHKFPEQAQKLLRRSAALDEPQYLSERHLLGFDHAMVGGALAKVWDLPAVLHGAIRYHHEPTGDENGLDTLLVHIADGISHIAEAPEKHDTLLARIAPIAWKLTRLSPDIIEPVVQEAHPLLFDGLATLMPVD
jgi:HD-like signal output (HDOD) protein